MLKSLILKCRDKAYFLAIANPDGYSKFNYLIIFSFFFLPIAFFVLLIGINIFSIFVLLNQDELLSNSIKLPVVALILIGGGRFFLLLEKRLSNYSFEHKNDSGRFKNFLFLFSTFFGQIGLYFYVGALVCKWVKANTSLCLYTCGC